jgi:hypothetical protein
VNAAAKMKYHQNYDARPQLAAITFDDGKPSEEVRQVLKDGGYRWNGQESAWEKPIKFERRAQDRADAAAVFNAVADMRMQEMGTSQQR